MANYSNLIATIQTAIRQNGNGEITGQLLQTTLAAMVASLGSGFQYKGVATPATNPGSPDENVFYFAPAGTYPYFGNKTIPAGKFGILKWAVSGSWSAEVLNGVGASALSYVAVASIADLPDPGVDGIGYLVGDNLYLYVGTGGDTAGGKYQDCGQFRGPQGVQGIQGEMGPQGVEGPQGPQGMRGEKGDQGNSGYTGAAGELEVVNNLTQGGATAALSAEMGKQLGAQVYGVEGGDVLIPYDRADAIHFSILNTGKWSSSNYTIILPITPGKQYRVNGDTRYTAIIAILNSADNIRSGAVADFSADYPARIGVLPNNVFDFIAPEDGNFISMLIQSSSGQLYPTLSEHTEAVEGLVPRVEVLEETILETERVVQDTEMVKKNIYIGTDGVVASGYTSTSIDITEYGRVIINNNASTNIRIYYTLLKEDIVLGVAPVYAQGYTGVKSVSHNTQRVVEIPSGAVYLYISINTTPYPAVTLIKPGYEARFERVEAETSALSGIEVPLDYADEQDGTSGIAPALDARTGGGKVVIPLGIYGVTQQIVIPGRNLNIEGAVWNYPQDPNGVHPSNTGTKIALLSNEIESVFKTNSDMSGMRIAQIGIQGLTTAWDYENADGNGADYYFDPASIKNVGLYIGAGRFDQVLLHRISFCGLAVGILAKYTIDANVWSEINADGCDFGIFVDYGSCHHPKIINCILSDCVGSGLYYDTTAGQNSYGLVADGNVLVRNASYLTPAQISAGIVRASLVLIGQRFASVVNNTIILSGVYKRQVGGQNYTEYPGGLGMYFTGDHNVIAGNKIAWSTAKAATISGNYNTISGNMFQDAGEGVTISGGRNAITGNVFDCVLAVSGNHNTISGNTHTGTITIAGNENIIYGGPSDVIVVSGNGNTLVGFSAANITDNGEGTIIK